MSLREEIHGVLVKSHFYPTDAVVDVIISKIKKRIDGIYDEHHKEYTSLGIDIFYDKIKDMLK